LGKRGENLLLRTCNIVVLSNLLALVSFGQTLGGITGEVKDRSGAAITDAAVTVSNDETNASRSTTSNEAGAYSFPGLTPGTYTVKVERPGFAPSARKLELQVQQTARVDFTLEVGQVNQSVEVSAQAAMLNTEDATVGTVIDRQRIQDLPLNGRNFLQLVSLSPNVTAGFAGEGQADQRQGGSRTSQNMAIAGMRSQWNNFTLDGVSNTDPNFNTYVVLPSVDMLLEFKVQTGIYPAEFGREATQINVSTRGGTNSYHGALYEFVRNDKFDAKQNYSFSASDQLTPKNPFQWNQYGFAFGGPVRIPKVVNGRNKLFFIANYERFRQVTRPTNVYSVASAAMRNGDFSELTGVTLWDPQGRSLAADGKTVVASSFPSNVIPTARISPISAKLFAFDPLPNSPSEAAAGTIPFRNFRKSLHNTSNRDQFHVRGDYVESSKSSWFGRYSWSDEAAVNQGLALNGTKVLSNAKQAVVTNTRTITNTIVNEFRFGANRLGNTAAGELAYTRDVVSELNIPNMPAPNPASFGIPSVTSLTTTNAWGGNADPYVINDAMFQWVDNVSWIKGRHSLRFGAEIRRDRFNYFGNQFLDPEFQFNGQMTRNPSTNAGGTSLADFFLGYTSAARFSVSPAFGQLRSTAQYYYAQDTWRVRPNLTLDFGLRYEYTEPYRDRSQKLTNIYIPKLIYGVVNVAPELHPTIVRAGSGDFYEGLPFRFSPSTLNGQTIPVNVARDGRMGDALVNPDSNDFAPRIGISWSPNPKWTIRAGSGIFYSQEVGNTRFDMARSLAGRIQTSGSPTNFPTVTESNFVTVDPATGIDRPAGAYPGVIAPGVWPMMQNVRDSYTLQWLVNVQREVSRSTVLEVGYIGSISRHLWGLFDANEPIPSGNGSSTNSRAPYPEFSILQTIHSDGRGSYQSGAAKLTRRFQSGLTALIGYTYAKSIDSASAWRGQGDANSVNTSTCLITCEKGVSGFDVTHRMVSSVIYELPFGKGRMFGSHWNALTNHVLGGWQVSSILTLQSGLPANVLGGRSSLAYLDGQRPNATGQPIGVEDQNLNHWFNTAAVALPAQGVIGNIGRNVLRGPSQQYWDFSAHKAFRILEGHELTFRFEAFNFPNHPGFGRPGTNIGTTTAVPATFGVISSLQNNMRQIQLGLKYTF
jgi:hypothetical protein